MIFEVFKSERGYVADLEAVEHVGLLSWKSQSPGPLISFSKVFIEGLRTAKPDSKLVYKLTNDALIHIIVEATLKSDFRSAYETYIKHYPLAESPHRKQLKTNRAYEVFILSVSTDPRIRNRDLIIFLSLPVTKLPCLNLLLEQTLKLTDLEHGHPDIETLSIILDILKDCIKCTQPGDVL